MMRWSFQELHGCVAGRAERDPERLGELVQLRAPLAHPGGRFGEVLAAARSNLDLRRDQLADEVLLERGSLRGRLQLLEAVRQLERLWIEDRELLLDRDREVRGRSRTARARKRSGPQGSGAARPPRG